MRPVKSEGDMFEGMNLENSGDEGQAFVGEDEEKTAQEKVSSGTGSAFSFLSAGGTAVSFNE